MNIQNVAFCGVNFRGNLGKKQANEAVYPKEFPKPATKGRQIYTPEEAETIIKTVKDITGQNMAPVEDYDLRFIGSEENGALIINNIKDTNDTTTLFESGTVTIISAGRIKEIEPHPLLAEIAKSTRERRYSKLDVLA